MNLYSCVEPYISIVLKLYNEPKYRITDSINVPLALYCGR